VSVNYVKPVAAAEDHLVCYAVEAREQTETLPEFVVAKDPRDPVFYSTCFVRETAIQWLAPPGGNPVPETTDTCVDCNAVPLGDPTLMCSGNVAADEAMPSDVSGSSSASGSDGGSAAGIAIGVILALVATVAIAVLVHRKRQSTATGRYGAQQDKVQMENPMYSADPAPAVPMPSRKPPKSAPATGVTRPTLPARQPPTAAARPAMPSRPAVASRPAVTPKPRVATKPAVAKKPSAVTHARPKSVAIQPQWEVVVDKEDKSIYFYDAVGDTTQWESPFAPCWTAELDDELDVFWVNSETGASQWEMPEESSSM
jgi:hypothetical protein